MVPPSRCLSATRSSLGLSRLRCPRFLAPFPNSSPVLSPVPETEAPEPLCWAPRGKARGHRLARAVRL